LLFIYGFFYFLTFFIFGIFFLGLLVLPTWGNVAYGLALITGMWYVSIICFFRRVKRRGEDDKKYGHLEEEEEEEAVAETELKEVSTSQETTNNTIHDKLGFKNYNIKEIIKIIQEFIDTYIQGLINHYMLFLFSLIIMIALSVGINLGILFLNKKVSVECVFLYILLVLQLSLQEIY
jgi:hypothetical protein